MAYKITNDCINCGVCEVECPSGAIFPAGFNWRIQSELRYALSPDVPLQRDSFYSEYHYYIVPGKCTECRLRYDEPMCVLACPIGGVVKDNMYNVLENTLFCNYIWHCRLN